MNLLSNPQEFKTNLIELIRRASCELPADIIDALKEARNNEEPASSARSVFDTILKNIVLAKENSTPICQDTGTNIYEVHYPIGVSTQQITQLIKEATVEATKKSFLRPNVVDSLTGKNTGNNLGTMAPYIHFSEWDQQTIEVKLMLKGGGSENVCAQYKLPDGRLKAGRSLDGIYRCVLDAVNQAQGQGCAPGILGIGFGGDRMTSMMLAKQQLFRRLDDKNEIPDLATLETRLLKDINTLGIGPMGFGGKTTVLGVKINHMHRLPASFFVSIAYMCWAHRRKTMTYENGKYQFN